MKFAGLIFNEVTSSSGLTLRGIKKLLLSVIKNNICLNYEYITADNNIASKYRARKGGEDAENNCIVAAKTTVRKYSVRTL